MKFYLVIFLILFSCSQNVSLSLQENVQQRFENGKLYFKEKKYNRAKEEFEFVVMNNPGSIIALDSRFFLGDIFFELEEYNQSIIEFDRFARFSQNPKRVEEARFKICISSMKMSYAFSKDQYNTLEAMNRLQEFIEDYPNSNFIFEASSMILNARNRLAKKELEASRLYLKLQEYDAALIYLNNVLLTYYDTEISDEIRLTIVFTFLLSNQKELAINFLKDEELKFKSADKLAESYTLVDKFDKGFGISNFFRLYK